MGVNTILTHSGRGDQSVEVRSVNPVVMRASTILFKDYDTWQKYRKLRATDRVLSYPENRGIYTQSDSPKKSSRNIWSLAVVSVDQRY